MDEGINEEDNNLPSPTILFIMAGNLSQVPLIMFLCLVYRVIIMEGRDINVFFVTCGTCFLEGTICH